MTRSDPSAEAARRRTFAVISHPDAGKSTLTEALALHAAAISQAGAVHGKSGRAGVVSDWMEMERDRGISITSAALQFTVDETVINLLDTPGHADFSEDTYRVLTAVDSAVMLLDAARGLESQTLKLFEVCRRRNLPVITVINKWDRPGHDALALMDEIEKRIDLRPTPLTWPVGIAGDFRGVLDRRTGRFIRFLRTAGGVTRAPEEYLDPERAAAEEGQAWRTAVEESDLLHLDGADLDVATYRSGRSTPTLFASAVQNFGVGQLLHALIELAPAPGARTSVDGVARPLDAPFSGVVFKVQSGMDPRHRDRLAFLRVCTGVFERGGVVTHAQTGKPFTTKYAQQIFGRDRETVEVAHPGDVVGLVNATALRVGDTLFQGKAITYPPMPTFAPEHFVAAHPEDSGRYKQFRSGVDQLHQEGVVQLFHSETRGNATPVLGAVGPMQFDVAAHRLRHEFSAPARLEPLPYSVARRTDAATAVLLGRRSGTEALSRPDGELVAVFADSWRMNSIQREFPDACLLPIITAVE